MQRLERAGSLKPAPFGGHRPRKLADYAEWLYAAMAIEPDITLAELQSRLCDEGLEVSLQAINDMLDFLGYSFKKALRASEQDLLDIVVKRRRWLNWQTWLKPERLVFIDETGAKTNMTWLRGRSLRGQRLHAATPWGHWKTTTFVAVLRNTGLRAEMLLGGPMNKEAVKSYVEQILVANLKPGDVVMMDNLSSHKSPDVRRLIRAAKAFLLYFPQYSPDLNPIEQAFAKLKNLLRKAAKQSLEGLWHKIASLLDCFRPEECMSYSRNSGYGSLHS